MTGFWDDAEVISSYTRAQAIEDGVLVALDDGDARESGFKVPVALTRAVWHLLDPTEEERDSWGQSVSGRRWDLLWMAHLAIKRAQEDGNELLFPVIFEMRGRDDYRDGQHEVTLKLHSGPGDEMEHVITIMLPGED